jgi:hypothetical protein
MIGLLLGALTVTNVVLRDLGYPRGIAMPGTDPTTQLRFPVYPGLDRFRLSLPIELTPLDDPRSAIAVSVNGHRVVDRTLEALHGSPIQLDLPVTAAMGGALDVTVAAHIRNVSSACHAIDPLYLGARLGPLGSVSFEQQAAAAATSPATYAGRYAVIVAPNASNALQDRAVALAYQLHRTVDWRHADVIEAPVAVSDRRNVDPAQMQPPAQPDLPATDSISLQQLGTLNLAQSGSGEFTFAVPFSLAAFGGVPDTLVFHASLRTSAFENADRAHVDVLLNGIQINHFAIPAKGGLEQLRIPIDPHRLQGFNTLSLVAHYAPANVTCAHNPRLVASLEPSSVFRWSGHNRKHATVGQFLGMLSGRVVVLVEPSMHAAAFDVMNTIGSISGTLRALDIRPLDAGIPPGYDFAIVVAPEDPPVDLPDDTVFFTIHDGPTPSLHASVYGDPAVFSTLPGANRSALAASDGTVAAIDRSGTFLNLTAKQPQRQHPFGTRRQRNAAIIVLFALLLLVALMLVARRARSLS